tara:strand:+ start:1604 stop:2215 length:612 start_codon:yes stop_codon:yes gene_type:complete
MEHTFTEIYNNNLWGGDSGNGVGNSITYNTSYINFLREFITDNNIRTVSDFGCGDFGCGNLIYEDLDITYQGYDVYQKYINDLNDKYMTSKFTFTHLDCFNNKELLMPADLCIIKDVLQHWSLLKIYIFMDYLTQANKFKYILIINDAGQKKDNTDVADGQYRALDSDHYPLKRYKAIKQGYYKTKEVSLIKVQEHVENLGLI